MPMEPIWVQCSCRDLQRCDKCGSQNLRLLVALSPNLKWVTCDDCAHVFEATHYPKESFPTDTPSTATTEQPRFHPQDLENRTSVLGVLRRIRCHLWARKGVSTRVTFVRLFLSLALVAAAQTRLDSARWWCSPTVVSALTITQEQATTIERLYNDSLPVQRQTSERIMGLTVRVSDLIHRGIFDNELLQATAELAGVHAEEADIRRRMLQNSERVLTQEQRAHLARLLALNGLME
jgi:Spy/CpxP family protein refolding chaperone